ncbi:hypothetical protein C8A03DRAFT_41488 [Achaetomium macrosporum]|uniref:Integral membrane protein n=1 Tax=Achaetomium macrosporum TaxID=79813 RepID=A0AAN7CGA9_9PEZI|nr:hypothetical protein C8A03DRAFT_41488 [Achaetomium macrosporum]
MSTHRVIADSPSRLSSTRRKWDSGIPTVLRPVARAYLLGFATAVGPRLVALLVQHGRWRRKDKQATAAGEATHGEPAFLTALQRILWGGLDWRGFPIFCAAVVGGTTFLERPLRAFLDLLTKDLSAIARRRLSRWFAAFIAAWLSFRLRQSKRSPAFTDTIAEPGSNGIPGPGPKTVHYAGRTLDLTLLAVTSALDVIVGELWHRHRLRRQAAGKWTPLEAAIGRLTDPALFALSSGLIMWTWIYQPSRLPRSYNKWIGSAAAVDARLIEALQRCREGTLLYGRDTGQAPLLTSMCTDYGWPAEWGDPARSIPFPCEMVHMGCGPSCEYHAAVRFLRSFRWAFARYLPIFLFLTVRRRSVRSLRRAPLSAARSSAFLAAFITLFYYGVCLARTRLGPRVLGRDVACRQRIDGGYCVAAGCLLCGWSILLEARGRRKDMALFVAPRALATLLPRRYALDKQWRETLAFAASTAVVLTCALENRRRVRGVVGSALGSVFAGSA